MQQQYFFLLCCLGKGSLWRFRLLTVIWSNAFTMLNMHERAGDERTDYVVHIPAYGFTLLRSMMTVVAC